MSARLRTTEPFFIVTKAPLNAIIGRVEGTSAAFCVSVFIALRWLANDVPGDAAGVEATVALIAYRAGVSYNTAAKALDSLESIGVIAVRRREIPGTKGRAPSIYSFPSIAESVRSNGETFTTARATSPALWATFPTEPTPPVAERNKEESKEPKETELAGSEGPSGSEELDRLDISQQTARNCTQRPDECFLALANADGSDPAQLTGSGKKAIAVALASIRGVCPNVTSEEIKRRAQNYHRVMSAGTRLTAHALAKHWARCDVVSVVRRPPMMR